MRTRGLLGATGSALCALASLTPAPAAAQWAKVHQASYTPGGFNWQLRRNFPIADRLLSGLGYTRASLFESLWTRPDVPASELEQRERTRARRITDDQTPRLAVAVIAVAPEFAKLAPEAAAIIDWASVLHRQVADVWADPSLALSDKDARITELLMSYRTRTDVAVSTLPKGVAAAQGEFYAGALGRRYPGLERLLRSNHRTQARLYEVFVDESGNATRRTGVDAAVTRFRQEVTRSDDLSPDDAPEIPVIAPTLGRRYPDVAAILANVQMLEAAIADILASPDVPRSAKRREILGAARLFRNDSPSDTTPPGGAMDMAAMPAQQAAPNVQALIAIHQRMMADPVIRERVATDPVLQRMIAQLGPLPQGAQAAPMSGMPHDMGSMAGMTGMQPGATAEERRQAVEFIVRLLSDPTVESRIHSDPELHRLWSDPDVQRRLSELRASKAGHSPAPSAAPRAGSPPPTAPNHQHP
jgi:hypothetical protein